MPFLYIFLMIKNTYVFKQNKKPIINNRQFTKNLLINYQTLEKIGCTFFMLNKSFNVFFMADNT